ncbi:MAG TPA: c-type cytochrome [Acidobacteriota bacterium]|nr:c-type cytochrome [Acidobacteriota bacterium]
MTNSMLHRPLPLLSLFCFLAGAAGQQAQDQWQWPEEPENLLHLRPENLRPVMRGFAGRLGVTCAHCHVGEEGAPLSSYDFASDANPNKKTARLMLQMLGDINRSLKEVEPTGERVNMWCGTCHRGRPRPMTVAEEFREAYSERGIQDAVQHIRDLRERFYGRGAYDFSERTLNSIGYALLRQDLTEDAITVFRLNAEYYPESANVWDSLAEAYMQAGKPAQAVAFYQKSLQLDPTNQNAVLKLEELRR